MLSEEGFRAPHVGGQRALSAGCTSFEANDKNYKIVGRDALKMRSLMQKSLESLAGAACLWKHPAHLSSCESGFRQAAFDEPDNGRRFPSVSAAGCQTNRRSAKSHSQSGRACLPGYRMPHSPQHGFWNVPDAPEHLRAAIAFGPRTCEASCWCKLPARPEGVRRDWGPDHYPNRQARPIGDGAVLFESSDEVPKAPNLR